MFDNITASFTVKGLTDAEILALTNVDPRHTFVSTTDKLYFTGTTGAPSLADTQLWETDGTDVWRTTSGTVGVGAQSTALLGIYNGQSAASPPFVAIENVSTASTAQAGITYTCQLVDSGSYMTNASASASFATLPYQHHIFSDGPGGMVLEARDAAGAIRFVTGGTADLAGGQKMHIKETGEVGIGTDFSLPLGTLHVRSASAGAYTPNTSYDDLLVENSAHGGITVVTPDNQNGRLAFASPTVTGGFGAVVQFHHDNALFQLGTKVTGGDVRINTDLTTETARFKADGSMSLAQYGSGTKTGTIAHLMAVTTTGDIIEPTPQEVSDWLDAASPVRFIVADYTLEDSSTFIGTVIVKNVTVGPLNILTETADKFEGADTTVIAAGESFTIAKYAANDFRII